MGIILIAVGLLFVALSISTFLMRKEAPNTMQILGIVLGSAIAVVGILSQTGVLGF